MKDAWLVLKSWTFSDGKTVNAVLDSKGFNEFKQINIFNQPTWYAHIMIKTPNDLINLLKDIYIYHFYYNSYEEKMEQLATYKKTLYNIENTIQTSKQAYNLPKPSNPLSYISQKIKIYFGSMPICNLIQEQIKKEINYIENTYLRQRKIYTDKYWEDLLLDYFNYISLDEAQIYFGARSWDKNFSWKNEFLKDFISYPVKLNTKLEPIVQNPNMLDINFRRQASTYKLHKSYLFWIIQKTEILDISDPEKVNLAEAKIQKKSYRLNLYPLFWFPRVQYYRRHLIRPSDPDIYTPGDYFNHIKRMTKMYHLKKKKNKTKSKNDRFQKWEIKIK